MKDCITDFLGLQGYIIYKIEVNSREVLVKIGRPKKESRCLKCGEITRKVHSRADGVRKVFHGFLMDRVIYLLISPRRFRCGCGKTHTERLPGIELWQRQSAFGQVSILRELANQSFKAVFKKTGISYWASRRMLGKRIGPVSWQELIKDSTDGYLYLGIDEHSFRSQNLVITVTEIRQRKLLTILPNDQKKTLKEFLRGIPEDISERIKEVCIDMKSGFLDAVREELSDCLPVVDPFHVIQDANRRVDEARRIEQDVRRKRIPKKLFLVGKERVKEKERLSNLLREYPNIKNFYVVKERLRDMYRCMEGENASEIFSSILIMTEQSDDVELMLWGRTLKRWRTYILNHFLSGTTNAYTEGAHTKIKMLKRISYGFRNVNVYVRKMLLGFLPPFALYLQHTF